MLSELSNEGLFKIGLHEGLDNTYPKAVTEPYFSICGAMIC